MVLNDFLAQRGSYPVETVALDEMDGHMITAFERFQRDPTCADQQEIEVFRVAPRHRGTEEESDRPVGKQAREGRDQLGDERLRRASLDEPSFLGEEKMVREARMIVIEAKAGEVPPSSQLQEPFRDEWGELEP